jgi:MoaA/NifB/PqqE/SkfB family radical SAM enzyme
MIGTVLRAGSSTAAADSRRGGCAVPPPAAMAEMVEAALLHFDGQRYRLQAWVVMPNHVHALLTPIHPHDLSEIIFSVDGGTKDTYEAIRRGADWERLLDVLGLVAERKNKAGSQKPTIRFNFTCMSRNIVELPAVVRLAGTYHVRSVHVRHLVIPRDPEARIALRDELKYRSAFNSVAKEAQGLSQKCGVNLVLPESVGAGDVQARRGTKLTEEQNPYCLLPWMQGIIKPNGDVQVCSRFPPMGNVRHESFDGIWGGAVLRALRRRLLRRSPDACSWHCLHEASTDRGDDR